jgi:OOP family OmpA-OmpF porin
MHLVEFSTVHELRDIFMKKIVLTSLLAMAVGGASAQIYLGGGAGITHVSSDCSGSSACDATDSGYKLYLGYKITENFAIEAGYADLGKASAAGVVNPYGTIRGELTSTAPFLVAVGRYEFLPKFTGVARLGMANVETTFDLTQVATGIKTSKTETDSKVMYGLGLEYAFSKKFSGAVDADFTRTAEVWGESGTVRMISLSGNYSF